MNNREKLIVHPNQRNCVTNKSFLLLVMTVVGYYLLPCTVAGQSGLQLGEYSFQHGRRVGCYEPLTLQYNRDITRLPGGFERLARLYRTDTIRHDVEPATEMVLMPCTYSLTDNRTLRIQPLEGFTDASLRSGHRFRYELRVLGMSSDPLGLKDTIWTTLDVSVFTSYFVVVNALADSGTIRTKGSVVLFGGEGFESSIGNAIGHQVSIQRDRYDDDSIEVRAYKVDGYVFSHWTSSVPAADNNTRNPIKIQRLSCERPSDVEQYNYGDDLWLVAHYIKAPPPPPRDTKYVAISTDSYATSLTLDVRYGENQRDKVEWRDIGFSRFPRHDDIDLRGDKAKNWSFVFRLLTDTTYVLSGPSYIARVQRSAFSKGGKFFLFSNVASYNREVPEHQHSGVHPDSLEFGLFGLPRTYATFSPDTLRLYYRFVPGPSSTEPDIAAGMSVFPNPASGEDVTLILPEQIQNRQVLVTISDQQGRIVFRQESTAALNAVQLRYGNLEQGRYHIAVQSGSYVGATSLCIIK